MQARCVKAARIIPHKIEHSEYMWTADDLNLKMRGWRKCPGAETCLRAVQLGERAEHVQFSVQRRSEVTRCDGEARSDAAAKLHVVLRSRIADCAHRRLKRLRGCTCV